MSFSLQTGLNQSQKLVMTRTLKQAIELLQLSTVELYEQISRELIDNPVLEEDADSAGVRVRPGQVSGISPDFIGDDSALTRNEERQLNFGDAGDIGYTDEDQDKKRKYFENIMTQEDSLSEHLLRQARMMSRDDRELDLFQRIITSLNDHGFLNDDTCGLCREGGHSEERIREALGAIQFFDPIGCAVTDVRESLCVQCRHYYPADPLLHNIIADHFVDFEHMNYKKIARSLNLPVSQVVEKSRLIQNLDPYPGWHFSNKSIRYIMPDVDVKLVDGEILVSHNDDWVPGIRINSYYNTLLKKKNIEKKLREYIQDKMQSARYLIKNIDSRRNTIFKVVNSIMEHQREFLERGPGHLKPLTHVEIARNVDLHESTISRVTSNKYVQTCWGVFHLKCFFVSRVRSAGNEKETSSDQIMNLIRDIVEREDSRAPLSDEEIVTVLGKAGIAVARRTVAKYRGILHIPSSDKRKKINIIKSEERT